MISLSTLAALAAAHADELDRPVAPVTIGGTVFDLDAHPALMGCINLSGASTYRDSVAPTEEAAVRRGRVLTAQGADLVDLGAESSTPLAPRVGPAEQLAVLVPVVRRLADDGVRVSVETYHPQVARECLAAGAAVINYSGGVPRDAEMFDVIAEHAAAVVLCHVPGEDVRELQGGDPLRDRDGDPIPALLEHFAARVEVARSRGVTQLVIDPGIGFSFSPSHDPLDRIDRQARMLLHTFRLRALGLPVCHAIPHAFHLFEDEFRTGEGLFAVLAHLGGTGLFRTHEVARLRPVLRTLRMVSPG